jgi:hypothetical protein
MPVFKGYMRMYAKTVGTSVAKTQYTEDWADTKKRKKIMGKPRKYSITIYLYNVQGAHIVESMPLNFKGTQSVLSNLVYQQINRMMEENPYQEFDLVSSYINIRV